MTDIEVLRCMSSWFMVLLRFHGNEITCAPASDILRNENISLGNEVVYIAPISEKCIQISTMSKDWVLEHGWSGECCK